MRLGSKYKGENLLPFLKYVSALEVGNNVTTHKKDVA